jgi:heme exporter protein D
MIWGSASEFFAMGGYGLYVWGSFGVTFVCMAADALIAIKRHHTARSQTGENG